MGRFEGGPGGPPARAGTAEPSDGKAPAARDRPPRRGLGQRPSSKWSDGKSRVARDRPPRRGLGQRPSSNIGGQGMRRQVEAFSLIEVLLAAAILSILIGAIIGVIR